MSEFEKDTFFERLESLCQDIGFEVYDLGKYVKPSNSVIGKAAIYCWSHGVMPTNGALEAISAYFNVDTNWLLTGRFGK